MPDFQFYNTNLVVKNAKNWSLNWQNWRFKCQIKWCFKCQKCCLTFIKWTPGGDCKSQSKRSAVWYNNNIILDFVESLGQRSNCKLVQQDRSTICFKTCGIGSLFWRVGRGCKVTLVSKLYILTIVCRLHIGFPHLNVSYSHLHEI